ncbi:MAG: hypothetical protein AAB948_01195 [Patescibacteria group bacterium]
MDYTGKNAQLMRFLGIVVLIVLLAGLTYWYQQSNKPKVFPRTDAAEGQVISGFPEELIFHATKVNESYLVDYEKKQIQYTVDYNSKDKLVAAFAESLEYLEKNNYRIINQRTEPTSAGLYGKREDGDINILIQKLTPTTTNFVISFVKKIK